MRVKKSLTQTKWDHLIDLSRSGHEDQLYVVPKRGHYEDGSFQKEAIPLAIAKEWDLHDLAKFLPEYKHLYPEPKEARPRRVSRKA